MTQSKPLNLLMKRSLPFVTLTCTFILCVWYNSFANENGFFQQKPVDSVPKKVIGKVKITVKDLMDGTALDSAYVSLGSKRGYTDNNGVVQFDSVVAGN